MDTKYNWYNIIPYRHAIDPSKDLDMKLNEDLNSVNLKNHIQQNNDN
jgi:hypothetical protein